MKIIQGACFLPCTNKSRTREAPTPTNISTKSDPLILKKGTPASPAIARASNVLPVPGAPMSNTPFGILPPRRVNFRGSLRNSTISWSSSLASSIPATSSKVTFSWESVISLALLLPNDRALPPPTCICRMKKIHTPISSSMGTQDRKTWNQEESSLGLAVILTPLLRSSFINSGSFGA